MIISGYIIQTYSKYTINYTKVSTSVPTPLVENFHSGMWYCAMLSQTVGNSLGRLIEAPLSSLFLLYLLESLLTRHHGATHGAVGAQ